MLTEENFIKKFPLGSIISYIPGKQFVRTNVRNIFRIDEYIQGWKGQYYMCGILCLYEFETNKYSKEYDFFNVSKWHCLDCSDEDMSESIGCLCHEFNDVRLANNDEKDIFNYCLNYRFYK